MELYRGRMQRACEDLFQLNCYNGKVVIVLNGGKSIPTFNHVKIAESLFVSSSRKAICSLVPRKA